MAPKREEERRARGRRERTAIVESLYLFRKEGEYWTLVYDDGVCRLRDSKGLLYLANLLSHCGTKIAAAELVVPRRPVASSGALQDPNARERARVNVTRAISAALRRIAVHHPALGEHLSVTVRTGRFCSYTPDPRVPIRWRV